MRFLEWLKSLFKPKSKKGSAMVLSIMPAPIFIGFNFGVIVPGGKLFVYNAGTSTKVTTWADSGGVTPHTNPIILDSSGAAIVYPPAGALKYVLAPANDTDPPTSPIWTSDGVPSTVASSSVPTTINVYSAAGSSTWSKATGASMVYVTLMGSGGAGGTGRRGAAGTLRGGGGGGSAGTFSDGRFAASVLGATETVVVGVGGNAVGGTSVNDTDGQTGTGGNTSRFGNWLTAEGGFGGARGTNAVGGAGGLSGSGEFAGGAGGAGSDGSATALPGATGIFLTGGGGGGGGGISAANVSRNGGAGGTGAPNAFSTSPGGVGAVVATSFATVGFSVAVGVAAGGGGGGGGAGTDHMNGFDGGTYGGGGGGGGASLNGTQSGQSGAGAQGLVIIMQI